MKMNRKIVISLVGIFIIGLATAAFACKNAVCTPDQDCCKKHESCCNAASCAAAPKQSNPDTSKSIADIGELMYSAIPVKGVVAHRTLGTEKCYKCNGTGNCATCNGRGKRDDGNQCVQCNGTGRCPRCQGTGTIQN